MKRLGIRIFALLVLLTGGWYLWHHKQIDNLGDAVRLARSQLATWKHTLASTRGNSRETIRIASFNIQAFGEAKLRDPQVAACLAQIIQQFDIVAVQELRGSDVSFLRDFVQQINAQGSNFDSIASPPAQTGRYVERTAFLFNRNTIEWDGSHAYSVQDPDDLMYREPFVGWFRAVHPESDRAFTFSLANVHLDARKPLEEIAALGQLLGAVRGDGRFEDDIVIAGDFNAAPQYLRDLQQTVGLQLLISGTATNVELTRHADNLLIHPLATSEFTGRAGVFDFLKAFNLTVEQASAISDHLPVWAEFSIHEGDSATWTASQSTRSLQ